MSLISNIIVNYKALFYKAASRAEMRRMGWKQILRDTNLFRRAWFDVIIQNRYASLVKSTPAAPGILKITMDNRTFHYPEGADLSVLGRTYYEIFDPHCGHFYDIEQTCPGPDDVILDIGSCEGLYALKHIGQTGVVHIFEPSRMMCRCLELTFKNEPSDKLKIWNIVLDSTPGETLPFVENTADPTLSRFAGPGESFSYMLEVQSIDSLCNSGALPVPTLIKMDVQGAELQILKGAEETIRRYKPRMAVTTYHYPLDAANILDYIFPIRPDYRYILKGVTTVDPTPRPTMAHLY